MEGAEEAQLKKSFRVLKPELLELGISEDFDYRDMSFARGKLFKTEITNWWVQSGKIGMACRVYVEGEIITDKDYILKDIDYVTDKVIREATIMYEYAVDAKNTLVFGCYVRKNSSEFGASYGREIFPTFHGIVKFGTAPVKIIPLTAPTSSSELK